MNYSTAAHVTFVRNKQKQDAEIQRELFELEKHEREIGIENDRAYDANDAFTSTTFVTMFFSSQCMPVYVVS